MVHLYTDDATEFSQARRLPHEVSLRRELFKAPLGVVVYPNVPCGIPGNMIRAN